MGAGRRISASKSLGEPGLSRRGKHGGSQDDGIILRIHFHFLYGEVESGQVELGLLG